VLACAWLHGTRNAGALAITAPTGFGIWTGMLVQGVDMSIVPLLGGAEGFGYADAWGALSVLVAVVGSMTAWWLLCRCGNQVGSR